MATTGAGILDALFDAAHLPAASTDPVDADRALARLGVVLQRLAVDGLSSRGATERERWVGETGRACAAAATDPASPSPGRLAQLSGAAADTVSILRDALGCENRWAFAVAIVDAVGPLVELVEHGGATIDRRRALIVADASATIVARSASLDPPSAAALVPLDWAVPAPVAHVDAPAAAVVTDAIAGLEYSTRPIGESACALSVADYLAVCTALETLSRSAARVSQADTRALVDAARRSGQGWAAARAALNPFDDGSRRPHAAAPPAVHYALALHDALRASNAPSTEVVGGFTAAAYPGAVRDAVQRIPAIAGHLRVVMTDWAETGRLLAYARDFAPRETRVREYLAGFRGGGLITADATDLATSRQALSGARLLAVELATRASERRPAASGVPRLDTANRHLLAQITDERLHAATVAARRALAANTGPPRGGRGPRR